MACAERIRRCGVALARSSGEAGSQPCGGCKNKLDKPGADIDGCSAPENGAGGPGTAPKQATAPRTDATGVAEGDPARYNKGVLAAAARRKDAATG